MAEPNAYTWKTDAITTEVVRHALETIAEEMGSSLRRTALSVVIKDMKDYACAVFDPAGGLLASALDIPTLLASMAPALKAVIEKWRGDIHPDDVFITNHPYLGSCHTNDIQVFVPVFDAAGTLLGFTGAIAHHADWGGTAPGTVQTASESVFEEGVMLPALKLEDRGTADRNVLDIIGANTRFPKQNFGDLRGQVACSRAGARRLEELASRYGTETLLAAFDDLVGYTEHRTRLEISRLADGVYAADGWLDDNGIQLGEPLRYAVTVTVTGDEIAFDFSGTAPQQRSGMNLPFATTLSVVHYAVKSILPDDVPYNEGSGRPVRIVAPRGTLTNPEFPAAVGSRHVSSQRLASVVTKAMVPLAPTRMSAEWSVGWPLFFGESTSPKSGDGVAVLLNVVGGAGASASGDGSDAVDVHMSNCALVPAEVVESGYMLRVERYELIQGSGGAGRYRGGLGLRADYRNISDRVMYARTEVEQTNPRFFPEGLDGGERGSGCAAALIAGDSGVETILPGKATTMLQPGDIISLRAGGGAGWGDPRDRDAALVAEDVANLKVFPGLVGSGR